VRCLNRDDDLAVNDLIRDNSAGGRLIERAVPVMAAVVEEKRELVTC
jgi:hypothetical protein